MAGCACDRLRTGGRSALLAGMFRSHPGEERCDAVDGIGMLFLALIYLETDQESDLFGWGW